jgi:NAD(P)-dependent dehydrogenase (short-subunit alcohol dehydrogenase family)
MIAEGFARRGAVLLITSRNEDACRQAAEQLRQWTTCAAVTADLATEEGVSAVRDAVEQTGQLDVLVNNAGTTWGAELDSYPLSGFDKVYDLNVRAVFRLTQMLPPWLTIAASAENPSRVINIGSIDGRTVSRRQNYAYSASKAAIHHLTRHLARELADRHVCVNTIAPGPFYSKMMAFALDDPVQRADIENNIPLQRIGEPANVVGATVFLSSRASTYLTGTILPVDGGYTACR